MSAADLRKLAAIMFTDMVGYSALSQRNEALALELLEEHRAIVRGILPRHKGREVKTMGDGFLLEFPSALAATEAAVDLQRTLHERNQSVRGERQVRLRIGIHVGDVVKRAGDIHGDGVNIGARLEPLAAPGGICVSSAVYEQVQNKLPHPLLALGPTELKNITLPVTVYRVVLPWEGAAAPVKKPRSNLVPALAAVALVMALVIIWWRPWQGRPMAADAAVAPSPSTSSTPAPAPVIDRKSIAVLPFANMSNEADSAFFADGVHEDIVTNLAVIRDLHVVSRTSVLQYRETTKPIRQIGSELGVAYVLEGSVRRAGNKVRVTGQLINASNDQHVWAKSYDRDVTDVFAIQAELSQAIAAALSAALSPQEKSLLENRPTTNSAAYDLYLKSRAFAQGQGGDMTPKQAIDALLEAVKLDSNFAEAWALLSHQYAFSYFKNEDHSPEQLARAKMAIETAVRLAPEDPVVMEALGLYHYYGYRDYARAAEQCRRLLLVRPNSADAHGQLGLLYRRQGRWADAIASLRKAGQLDPHNTVWPESLAETFISLRRFDDAGSEFARAREAAPNNPFFDVPVKFMPFLASGSMKEMDELLANRKPDAANETVLLWAKRTAARARGDSAQAVQIDQQHPYLDPFDEPHWQQDVRIVGDLVNNNELAAARSKARKLLPELNALIEKQPANADLWGSLALLYAFDDDRESALRCANKMRELVPESSDAVVGPDVSYSFAQILAWTGDKDRALAELARLLRVPWGGNVHLIRMDPGWLPLRGDPRFEALLKDPQNNAPLF